MNRIRSKENLKCPHLWEALQRIGVHVDSAELGPKLKSPLGDIEEVLVVGASEVENSPILISLLASWVAVHGRVVRTAKLKKMALEFYTNPDLSEAQQCGAFWLCVLASFATSCGYHKWSMIAAALMPLAKKQQPETWRKLAKLKGNAQWLKGSGLFLPQSSLRIREDDVAKIGDVSSSHPQYRMRLLHGAETRADVHFAKVVLGLDKPSHIAKTMHCSREAARRISQELDIAIGP